MLVFAALRLPTIHWKIPGTHTVLDAKEVVIVGAVVVVVILLILLLFVTRRDSEKNAVKKLLGSASPAERIAGVKLASNEELGRHVRALRRLSSSEKNPQVLKELAEVVARHQWEPSDDADVVELRIWAHRYYADRIPVRGPDGNVSPAPTPIEQRAPAPQPVPSVVMSPIPSVTMPVAAVPPSPEATVASYAEPEAAGAFTVLELARRREVERQAVEEDGEPPSEDLAEEPTVSLPVMSEEPSIPSVAVPAGLAVASLAVPYVEAPPRVAAPEEPPIVPEEPEVAPEEPVIAPEEPEVAPEEPEVAPEEPEVAPEEPEVAPEEPEVAPEEPEAAPEEPEAAPEEPEVAPFIAPFEATPAPFAADMPCILVTGAGGAAGVTVIRALMAAGHRVVGVDTDPLAVGLRLAHASQIIPSADDPQFSAFVCKLSVHQGAKGVISTVAEEMPSLSSHRELFDDGKIATWFPERGVVQACIDKWLFHLAAKSAGLPVPPTNLGSAEGVPGPWIVKPRFGRGSRDIMLVDTPEDLAWALGKVPSPLVQTRLAGREFTVDALIARDGTLAGAVPRWRLATRGGISTKGETFTDEVLVRLADSLLRGLALRGAANVQGFISKDGSIMFTEVNPRFSGGLALSLAAGADLVGQFVNGLFNLPIDPAKLGYRSGVRMLRYFDEVFEG